MRRIISWSLVAAMFAGMFMDAAEAAGPLVREREVTEGDKAPTPPPRVTSAQIAQTPNPAPKNNRLMKEKKPDPPAEPSRNNYGRHRDDCYTPSYNGCKCRHNRRYRYRYSGRPRGPAPSRARPKTRGNSPDNLQRAGSMVPR